MPDSGPHEVASAAETQTYPNQSPSLTSSLPGDSKTWNNCVLGPSDSWSSSLQSLVRTLTSLSHPAAIYWSDEYVLLHNKAWAIAGGRPGQGQRQLKTFNSDVTGAFQAAIHGGKPKQLTSHEFLNTDSRENYTTLVSPVYTSDEERPLGLLVQLFPDLAKAANNATEKASKENSANSKDKRSKSRSVDVSQLGQTAENVPLNEHPFFHRFAEMLPSGLAILDSKAQAIFVNQHFYDLTTHYGEGPEFNGWPQSIHPDDYERVMRAYDEAFKSQKQLRVEFRARGPENAWRLLLLTPLGHETLDDSSLREHGGFICSFVDISSEKAAELTERKAAKEARDRKEQQERFIDMISHEIRNPLSAVLHCNDDIAESVRNKDVDTKTQDANILSNVETIDTCILHMKNIVNDVLSYSKLDASMLSLSPKPSQPRYQLAASLKMLQPEFKKQGIGFAYQIDSSYIEAEIEWCMADLARIGQVLINLVSNAIKFTARKKGEKRITITLAGSRGRPDSYPPNVVFFNEIDGNGSQRLDATRGPEWGNGEAKYVMVAVKDTGIGISEEGQKRLFGRFRQATPKTEEVYGGSGLGLNISRKLCHLHGGEVGVSSKEDEGSTFGFYFKVLYCGQPQDHEGKAEHEEGATQEMRKQVTALGNASPSDSLDESLPDTLKNPPVVNDPETKPAPTNKDDGRYRKTLEIVASMSRTKPDQEHEYANAETPGHAPEDDPRDQESPATGADSSSNKHNSAREAGSDPQGVESHVLLVEDNKINQRIVLRKLQSKGYKVTPANNGQEAIDALTGPARNGFDIVLMDQEMPVMDGNTAARKIRELERIGEIEHVPILGLTANVRESHREAMKHSGMDDYIMKPYKIEELLHKIDEMITESKKRRYRISLR